ncbi:MAG: ATP-binding protein, partial [Acidimicrobiales bacterium]
MRATGARVRFPFSAVVGHDDVKLALLLNSVDPRIGGVLLRGQKGSAKTTLARGLAALLPGGAPFVELPLGATEDRLVGSLDVAAALGEGRRRFQAGLLAGAHGGVLYVDEVNLLADHLVDVLLDVAASGVNVVEREGLSESHPARFVLAGSMNPEEGDLRPQLLDRFGLAVDVAASADAGARSEAVRRRLAFDADPAVFAAAWAGEEDRLRARLAAHRPADLPTGLLTRVSALCASVGAEGLRADLVICRAAAALAGWEGEATATVEHVRRVAPLALAHRRRRSPFDHPGVDGEAIDDALRDPPPPDPPDGGDQAGGDHGAGGQG